MCGVRTNTVTKWRQVAIAIPVALITLYRKAISPLLPPVCRFSPSCSEYSLQAYRTRGLFAGTVLTCWRLLRCNPLCKPGYDPVPPPGHWRNPRPGTEKES